MRHAPRVDTPTPSCFISFQSSIEGIALPTRFTFPFYYEPHALSRLAATELQHFLENNTTWEHNFGFEGNTDTAIGKMFGVLVVKNKAGEMGYLAAFSGKVGFQNQYDYFVPPVFDMLVENSFYRQGEAIILAIHEQIETLNNAEDFKYYLEKLRLAQIESIASIDALKEDIKTAKIARDAERNAAMLTLTPLELTELQVKLNKESAFINFRLKDLKRLWQEKIEILEEKIETFNKEIKTLKETRKNKSSQLQQQLFEHYTFLNQAKTTKSLHEIFKISETGFPPSGAGECAAPKLLQYAFIHDFQPLAMAEFWWGQSPNSEIRKHKLFYPACNNKCKPILAHMLEGILLENNQLEINPAEGKTLPIVFEDEYLLVINKPAEFFSVPGKKITDSVQTRMKLQYPDATGPMIVHRLDASTSGLLLIAKNKQVHQALQRQFITRQVQKRYTALLDGIVNGTKGVIDLPLRVDLDDRPRQLVCYEHGKPAQTFWKVEAIINGQTKISFFPLTGRTHQLRVHAAHPKGLNLPIVGDDLYGVRGERLHLHAAALTFTHPITKKKIELAVEADFCAP